MATNTLAINMIKILNHNFKFRFLAKQSQAINIIIVVELINVPEGLPNSHLHLKAETLSDKILGLSSK